MQSDVWTRSLLLVIAVCLVVLVAQSVRPAADCEADGDGTGRYEVTVLRSRTGAFLLRWDRDSGQVWRTPLAGSEPWEEVGADLEEPTPPEEPAAVPEAPEPAAEPEPPA
jgi:hypothetical protein